MKRILKRSHWLVYTLLITVSPYALSLTLHEAVSKALTANPQIRSAHAEQMAAYHSIRQAKGGYLPRVYLQADYGAEYTENPILVRIGQPSPTLTRYDTSLIISESLFNGFHTKNSILQSKYAFQAAQFRTLSEKDRVSLETAAAYLNILRSEEVIKLAQKNIDIHSHILKMITTRVRAGAGFRAETALAFSRLEFAKTNLINANLELQKSLDTFESLVGEKPNHLRLPSLNSQILPKTEQQAIDLGLTNNPTLAQMAAEVKEAMANVNVSKSTFYPSVKLQLSATEGNNVDGIVGRNRDDSIMIVANYNLYNGGIDRASVDEAKAKHFKAIEDLQQTNREIIHNVQDAWYELVLTKQQISRLKQYIQSNLNVINDYQIQFKIGKRQLFNVLDAQRDQFAAEVALINARYDEMIASYQLCADIGLLDQLITRS